MNVSGNKTYTPLGFEALTPTSATKMDVPNGAKYALITVEVDHCRMTDDGTTATALIGVLLKTTDGPLWYAGKLSNVQFFENGAGSLVKILYYG